MATEEGRTVPHAVQGLAYGLDILEAVCDNTCKAAGEEFVRMTRTLAYSNDFARKVHEVVATIPRGKVATYGQIAAQAGDADAAQEVGLIMSRVTAGQNLPCHRVVNKTGTLAPGYAFGGEERQRALLEEEGIQFMPNGRIDMAQHLWGEYSQRTLF